VTERNWWEYDESYPRQPAPEIAPQQPRRTQMSRWWQPDYWRERWRGYTSPYMGAGTGRIAVLPQVPGPLREALAPRWERVPQRGAEAWRMGLRAIDAPVQALRRGAGFPALLALGAR
jgi:hypothetical protein